jgi:4-carboxymuconolactone decarboxylase
MPKAQPTSAETLNKIREFAPKLMELTDDVLFGDIWERPGLSKRDRSLITVATLVALYRINELPSHIVRARQNGISKDELIELFIHLAFYAGWPNAMTAVRTAMDLFDETE